MKVTLIHPQYRPDGGAEKAIGLMIEALREKGAQINIISRQWATGDDDIQVVRCNPFYIGRLWREWSFARKAAKIASTMDCDIIQSQVRLPGCDIYRAGGGVHREWLKQRYRTSSPLRRLLMRISPFHRYTQHAERRLYADARLKAVICNSRMVKNEIVDYFNVPRAKIHVIYNAVDLQAHAKDDTLEAGQNLRHQLGLGADHTMFLFVGSGFERKGLSVLLDCMALLPEDCLLVVVGKDKRIGKYRRKSRSLGIAQRVVFTGMQTQVRAFFAAADVFVLPTLYDAFANTVLEAMASSLPVITTLKCGAVDLIENGKNGFVCDAMDVRGLSASMYRLRDPILRKTVGEAGRKTVGEFSTMNMSSRLYDLYDKILG